jgi:rhodanese-related sulfurtransferase
LQRKVCEFTKASKKAGLFLPLKAVILGANCILTEVKAMEQYIEFASNHPYLSLAWGGILLALVVSWVQSLLSKIQFVTPTELTIKVNREDAVLLDIRSADDFKKGHITSARNIPLAQLSSQLSKLENEKNKPIIVVCQAGMSAQGAAKQLISAGFSQVAVLTGGMSKWAEANLPVVKK